LGNGGFYTGSTSLIWGKRLQVICRLIDSPHVSVIVLTPLDY
jgi:hypothetical protein